MKQVMSCWRLIVLALTVCVCGCYSAEHDPVVRRERLLAIYPPGQTTRADVQKKWTPLDPEYTSARPAEGWAALDKARVRECVLGSEMRTGKPVSRVDCYVGPDGMFGLCYCWFYYDEA